MATAVEVMPWADYRDRVIAFLGEEPDASREEIIKLWFDMAVETANGILARDDFESGAVPAWLELAVFEAVRTSRDWFAREQGVVQFTVGSVGATLGSETLKTRNGFSVPADRVTKTLLVYLRPHRAGKVQMS